MTPDSQIPMVKDICDYCGKGLSDESEVDAESLDKLSRFILPANLECEAVRPQYLDTLERIRWEMERREKWDMHKTLVNLQTEIHRKDVALRNKDKNRNTMMVIFAVISALASVASALAAWKAH